MTLAQQLVDERLPGSSRVVTVNCAESPLAWLHARKLITDRQRAAGELLRADFERAALGPRVTMRWDVSGVKAPRTNAAAPDPSASQCSAKARFDAALAAAGPGLSDIAWRTICAGETIPDAERALAWPARSGRLVLTLALDRLAGYYRVP